MRIEQANVQLDSRHIYTASERVTEDLNAWVDGQQSSSQSEGAASLQISKEGLLLLDGQNASRQQLQTIPISQDDAYSLTDKDHFKLQLLEQFIFYLTGKRMKFSVPQMNLRNLDKFSSLEEIARQEQLTKIQSTQSSSAQGQAPQGWGLKYQRYESYQEYEKTNFQAKASVKTADGKEIQVDFRMQMERSYYESSSLSIRAGDALRDPLVINYAGASGILSSKKFSFDLDFDGKPDQISMLKSGSGFLALDKDGNGKIDNGKELFGPETNSGFGELAQYDSDGNQWIDENDPIFNKLRIWAKDDSGKDQLLALGEVGIGAIYLGHADTEFTLRQGEINGKVRDTGFFLRENGTAGSIQEIDLKI